MDVLTHVICTTLSRETGVACRRCDRPIPAHDEFGRSESVCRRCRRR